jgi:predicted 3-demethylubiquinone-9 3-methyltransferase (glyoxalase superfamily)
MQKIIPNLWFDKNAEEAVNFYVSLFPNSKMRTTSYFGKEGFEHHGMPEGMVMTIDFEINGYKFLALNGGPVFKINPSISFFLNFDPAVDENARKNLDAAWEKLSKDGTVLMPLDKYPFSEHYGWVQDKFGVSWQLILTNPEGEKRPFIAPSLLFVGDVCGRAEEAGEFYLSIFKNSKFGHAARYPKGMEPDKEGTIMFSDFMLEGEWFAAMDSAHKHNFSFNEGISFIINCKSQQEVDYYWDKLISDGGQESMCGWLKDKFGVSWQVIPTEMFKYLSSADKEKSSRAMNAMLQMKKLDLNVLRKTFEGK